MSETRRAKIAKRVVDAAQPEDATYFVWDTAIPGFGLQVLPTGTKTFVFTYRNAQGDKRRPAIGKVGSLTAEEARDIAEKYSAMVKDGRDPLADRLAERESLTVGEMVDEYLKSPRFAEKADSTQAVDKGRAEGHIRPLLGAKYAAKIQPDDVRRMFAAIRDGKTAKSTKTKLRGLSRVRGGAGAARKSVRLLAAVYSWAIEHKLVTENPATGVKIGSDGEREALLDGDEYQRLFQTLETMENEGRLRSAVADVVRLIALTGARRSEAIKLRWSHVDLKNRKIVIPPARHKTGAATGKPRIIQLPALAQAVIARQPEGESPDALVFTPARGETHLVPEKPWRAIRKEAGLPPDLGLHGLRHSLASLLAIDGAEAPQLMTVLGHTRMSTTTKYLHFRDKARSALAERAAAPMAAALAAVEGKPKATVTPIAKGANRSG